MNRVITKIQLEIYLYQISITNYSNIFSNQYPIFTPNFYFSDTIHKLSLKLVLFDLFYCSFTFPFLKLLADHNPISKNKMDLIVGFELMIKICLSLNVLFCKKMQN